MAWWGHAIVVMVLVGCAWMWHHFSLFRRLDRGAGRDDDRTRAAREAMDAVDRGRTAGHGMFPQP